MPPGHENGDDVKPTDFNEINARFLRYNTVKYDNFLRRFSSLTQKHIKALPLFFHINQNLLPGYVNNHVPHTIYNYVPDAESIKHASIFNSTFNYDTTSQPPAASIEAVYLQDNLISGKIILWIIYNKDLEPDQIALLKEKAQYINKWRESKKMNLQCYVTLPSDMSTTYWGDKFRSLHPDKSIFLDVFYSESILVAGKHPAWWLVPPDKESDYEQYIDNLALTDSECFNTTIDFGSIAKSRPQDYLATAILNLIYLKHSPQKAWLNILDLCQKLAGLPQLASTSLLIKSSLYSSATECSQYEEVYCRIIRQTIDTIYGREQDIIIARTLKLVAHKHDKESRESNLFRILLAHRRENETDFHDNEKYIYEFVIATDILFDLVKQATLWFLENLKKIDCNIILPDGLLNTITNNLIGQTSIKPGYIAITNIHSINNKKPYSVCLKHNIENRNNNWSLLVVDNENNRYDIRQGKGAIELAAWAVFNRIITNDTRLSVNCPYMSIKQTQLADITSILLRNLPAILTNDTSLETFTNAASPIQDILIINEIKAGDQAGKNNIQIYIFQITNYGEVLYSQHDNIDGFLNYVCSSLSSGLQAGNKPHDVSMHCISSGIGNTFIHEAENIRKKVGNFVSNAKKGFTHFIDINNGKYYAIEKTGKKLIAHANIQNPDPEDYFSYSHNVLMNFSTDVDNHAVLNYLYRNNVYEYIQVFYLTQDNISQVYILDEKGILNRLSQPFHDQQSFINQWLMFLFNTRNRIKSFTQSVENLPNIEIYELTYNKFGQILKNRLNSAMLPSDRPYFDLKIIIQGDKGQQSIIFECEDQQFDSNIHGTGIYNILRKYLSEHFKSGASTPVYVTDVDLPPAQIVHDGRGTMHIRGFIKYKMNIEKRLNTMINKI